jgi:hypothetical protein
MLRQLSSRYATVASRVNMLTPAAQSVRRFNIHEYQSMEMFRKYDVPAMSGGVASSPDEAEAIATKVRSTSHRTHVARTQQRPLASRLNC